MDRVPSDPGCVLANEQFFIHRGAFGWRVDASSKSHRSVLNATWSQVHYGLYS